MTEKKNVPTTRRCHLLRKNRKISVAPTRYEIFELSMNLQGMKLLNYQGIH